MFGVAFSTYKYPWSAPLFSAGVLVGGLCGCGGGGGGCGCVFMFRNTHPCGLYINSGAAGHSTLQFEETGSSSLTWPGQFSLSLFYLSISYPLSSPFIPKFDKIFGNKKVHNRNVHYWWGLYCIILCSALVLGLSVLSPVLLLVSGKKSFKMLKQYFWEKKFAYLMRTLICSTVFFCALIYFLLGLSILLSPLLLSFQCVLKKYCWKNALKGRKNIIFSKVEKIFPIKRFEIKFWIWKKKHLIGKPTICEKST